MLENSNAMIRICTSLLSWYCALSLPVLGLAFDGVWPWSSLGQEAIVIRGQDLLDLLGSLGGQEQLCNLTSQRVAL